MRLLENDGKITLEFDGKTVFVHSADAPFITAVEGGLKYKSSHGSFEVKRARAKRIPLTDCAVTERTESEGILAFAGGNRCVRMIVRELDGALELRFESNGEFGVEFCFAAYPNEGIFGGGEQFRQLNMKGEKIVNFVSEHIVVPPIAQKLILKGAYKEKKHSYIKTYAPMSTYVSSEKYALRFDANCYGVADFSNDNKSIFYFSECPPRALYAAGDSFFEVAKVLNNDCPNREYLPDWCYDGMILGVQGGIDRAVEKAEAMLASGARVCAVWCQDWSGKKITAAGKQVYWNWQVDENLYPDLKNRIDSLKSKGVRFLAYINPYLVKDGALYNLCRERGFLIRRQDGGVYHVKATTFDAGMLDLTNPQAVDYIKQVLIKENMLDLNIDGYMADFGEYLPVDCVLFDGNPEKLHNLWPTMWASINREAVEEHPRAKEIMFFTRSAYNGAQKYTSIMWNGDQHTDFSKDYGMPCVMPATFNLGFSGMCALHSDIGGFISFASLVRDSELFVRWMEMCAFSPLMRSHETIRPEANAQPYDENILPFTQSLVGVHVALKEYLKSCMAQASDGVPIMRPDFYDEGDFALYKEQYSYRLGDEVFVCPVIERGASSRKVALPKGEWVKFFDGDTLAGGKEYTFDAPLGKPVAFYKKDGKFAHVFEKISL